MDIKYENAVFISEHQSEIKEVVNEFKRIRGKILSNTVLQLTRWDLLEKFYDASPFVDDNEITPNTLNLINNCITEAKSVLDSSDYQRAENAIKVLTKINTDIQHLKNATNGSTTSDE